MFGRGRESTFYGWRVVAGAFVLAVFGWGIGFYGPPVFLHAVVARTGWPVPLVSAAVTAHFLVGAGVVANLPRLYRRFGVPWVTRTGAILLGLGIVSWAVAAAPWQLFAATLLSGAGWVAMSAAAVNAILSPWFVRRRPAALATAYNGASVGGVVFSPLLAAAIVAFGFPAAAALVACVTAAVIWVLAGTVFARSPESLGLVPDGDAPGAPTPPVTAPDAVPLPGTAIWRDRRFLTLAAGMALGLFAQAGLLVHLYSLIVPALGENLAGLAMGLATAAAIAGRSLVGWLMPAGADRRLVACLSYGVQIAGALLLILAAGTEAALIVAGILLVGAGIGNATSLPPLIAQVEFVAEDVGRAVALIVATSQATFAFAPLVFGLVRSGFADPAAAPGAAPQVFLAAIVFQLLAIAAFACGRRRTDYRRGSWHGARSGR